MGLWDKLKGEFIDIIQWTEDGNNNEMVHRFERYQNEIKNGAQLTVRESQAAVFVNEGQFADVFAPGRYVLTTQNLPILSTLKGWKYGFNSPFVAEVYFVVTKQFLNLPWGTPSPILITDSQFGPLRVGARGNYSMQITDPVKFLKAVVGTDGSYSTEGIADQLRTIIVTRFSDALAESQIPVMRMAANYNELSQVGEEKIIPDFEEYGIKLTKFLVSAVQLPKEVQAALDTRSSMSILGDTDMNKYMQYQTGQGITAAANNPNGGGAAAGMGMGMGFGMANQMMNSMGAMQQQYQQQQPQQQMAPPPPIPQTAQYFVAVNGQQTGPFDLNTLSQMASQGQFSRDSLVWKQGMAAWTAASQVQELSNVFGAVPPPLPPM